MSSISTIGQIDGSITYIDRPTVKVIIKTDNTVLILNDGLLPGGGVDENESDSDAITRELHEEIGSTVRNIRNIGTVIQYRNFLGKRYVINGYVAALASSGGSTNPQDDGEAQLWLTVDDALELVSSSIAIAKTKPLNNDVNQSKLYNLMTTYELLKQLEI
jgi:ADP-ribose pyrophosphatase YjhB (NUDIX family)